ncbi:hypothetical protein, partial [uncultured Prevotella sp.]|uniref:hypothetical protein n=1 Tax=uncultured Prevotella sp. TaxID=159272 RepID=UPI00260997F6
SVSLRLQSLNQKTLTEYHRFFSESLHGFVFWIFSFGFSFDFSFDCTLTGQMGFETDFEKKREYIF